MYRTDQLAVVQRHDSPDGYRAPHAINHHSNLLALREVGVQSILAVNSTGSLREDLVPGTVLVPDDFINPWAPITFHDDEGGHGVSRFDSDLREIFLESVRATVSRHRDGGTYFQTRGPRFETPAEARMFSDFGDVIGMTAASEATLACELDLPYATVCMVDNYVNGIAGTEVDMESFQENVEDNVPIVLDVVLTILSDQYDLNTEDLNS